MDGSGTIYSYKEKGFWWADSVQSRHLKNTLHPYPHASVLASFTLVIFLHSYENLMDDGFILIYSFTGLCPWPLCSTHFGQKLKGTQVYCRKELFMSWQNRKQRAWQKGTWTLYPTGLTSSGILPLAQHAFIKLSQLLKVVCSAGNQHSKQACRRHFNTSYDTHYTLTRQGWTLNMKGNWLIPTFTLELFANMVGASRLIFWWKLIPNGPLVFVQSL